MKRSSTVSIFLIQALRWIHKCLPTPEEGRVIFGSGPVGLMAQKAAWLHGAERVIAVDPQDYRLEMARKVNKVEILNAHDEHLMDKIRDMTGGRGPDTAVDAVGTEAERSSLERLKEVVHLEIGTPKMKWLLSRARSAGHQTNHPADARF